MSKFEEFFSEPQHYGDLGVYAVAADSDWQALDKLTEYFMEWEWIPRENRRYVMAEIRETLRPAWVKWHGGIGEDGQMGNGWWLYQDWKGGRRGYKKVYTAGFDKHYAKKGHRWEPTIDEYGYRRGMNDCNICKEVR